MYSVPLIKWDFWPYHNKNKKSEGAKPWEQIWVFLSCSKALSWHWRHSPYLKPIFVLFFWQYIWRENIHLHSSSFLSFHAEGRACAVVFDCKFIETSAALHHNVKDLFEGIVRQIRLRKDSKEDNARRMANTKGERASAKRPSDSLAELWQRTIRRWLSKQNRSLATTYLCYRSFQQGKVLHVGWTSTWLFREECRWSSMWW